MVNQREPRARSAPDPGAVKDFVAGAADQDSAKDPNAPRKYNSLTIPFNQYEWELLEQFCTTERRSKSSLLRLAMIEYVTTRNVRDAG